MITTGSAGTTASIAARSVTRSVTLPVARSTAATPAGAIGASVIPLVGRPSRVAFQVAQVFHEVGAVFDHVTALVWAAAPTIAASVVVTAGLGGLVAIDLRATRTAATTAVESRRQKLTGQLTQLDAIGRRLPQKLAVQAATDLDGELAARRRIVDGRWCRLALRVQVGNEGVDLLLNLGHRFGAGRAFSGAVDKLRNARGEGLAFAIERDDHPIVGSRHPKFPF